MTEYIVELDSKHSIALKLAFAEEMRGGDFVRKEIVRCRDCRFRCLDECTRIDEGFKDYWFAIDPDGFCAWAERKEGGE